MERASTRDEVNQLDIVITEYMPDHMPQNFWKAYGRLLQLAKQAGWPEEIHKQYLETLDERDKAIERAETSEELLRYLRELLFVE